MNSQDITRYDGSDYGPQHGPQYQQLLKPIEEKDATQILENYLASRKNPNLKLGKIEDKILVDKHTGWMQSVC